MFIAGSFVFHASARVACRRLPSVSGTPFLAPPSLSSFPCLVASICSTPSQMLNNNFAHRRRAFASSSMPPPSTKNGRTVGEVQHKQNNNGGDDVGLYARYEQWLQGSYPALYKLHRMIVDGTKWCLVDLKTYFSLAYRLRQGSITLSDMNAHELFIYIQAGSQLVKLSLLAVVAAAPAGFPLLLISMLLSPRLVLTRHFWSDRQSQQFQTADAKRNERKFFPRIIEALQLHQQHNLLAASLLDKLPLTLEQLTSKQKAAVVLNIPQSLDALTWQHRFLLKRMKGLPIWATDSALRRHINLLQLLDAQMAEKREEIVNKLSVRDLQTHLYLRNLDFSRLTVDQMRAALVIWLQHFNGPSSCDPLLYAHVPVLTQANAADIKC